MQQSQTSAMDFLVRLGSVDQFQERADQQPELMARPLFNSHIHFPPNFSAFQTIEQAVSIAAEEGVKVLGAGNYYDYSVYQEFSAAAAENGIFPLFGTEIIALEKDLQAKGIRVNDPGNPGKYYICGKSITRFENLSKRAADLLNKIRTNDAERMRKMTDSMAKRFGEFGIQTKLDDQAVIDRVVKRHGCDRNTVILQERHVVQAFQEVSFDLIPADQRKDKLSEILGGPLKSDPENAVAVQNEIRSMLMKAGKPCFVPETFVSLAEAKELILELGGIPCYPTLADSVEPRCEYESTLEKTIEILKEEKYAMAELISVRNSPECLAETVKALRAAGIACVVGTEHNTLDLIPIAPTCKGGAPIPDQILDIFWEGTCVMVAHQFLSAHGQTGLVDKNGKANTSYENDDQRIKSLAALGSAVLETYFESIAK